MLSLESIYLEGIRVNLKDNSYGVIEVLEDNEKIMEIEDTKIFKTKKEDLRSQVLIKYCDDILEIMHKNVDNLIKGKSYC